MTHYSPRSFSLPKLQGISDKTIDTHLKLYEGYVTHVNVIVDHIEELAKDSEKYAYELGELQRRFSFEFGGMRNHERYFGALEGGPSDLSSESDLADAISHTWGSIDAFLSRFKAIASTRGIGWAMLYYDRDADKLLTQWVDEQHLGHLATCEIILPLDMWEHSYIIDYSPAEKKLYIDAFFKNLNWSTVNNWFVAARAK